MANHPYKSLPETAFWRSAVASPTPANVDPVAGFGLCIHSDTKVATAGSCFAQHISRHLKRAGFNYYVVETAHPLLPEKIQRAHDYGIFSCRYGNIYTARQLLQLFQRAFGRFVPEEDAWSEGSGVVLDPFRPRVQPGGFISAAEMRADRAQHLSHVRRMFETLDVFVFTLGLTECWRARSDEAVYPLCPGVAGGRFDPKKHEFYNQPVDEVINDLIEFRNTLFSLNPAAEIVLTVSPVPLVATAQPDEHVLSATTYSKSVLRVAAECLRRRYSNVHYFPSYEIITGNFNRGAYYAADLRNVLETGVNHVMRLFMRHATSKGEVRPETTERESEAAAYISMAEQLIEVECDEAALDRS